MRLPLLYQNTAKPHTLGNRSSQREALGFVFAMLSLQFHTAKIVR